MDTNTQTIGESAKKFFTDTNFRGVIEFAVIALVAVVVALIVRAFFLQLYFIPTGSMEPYLAVDDKIFVNKMSYQLHEIERGDLIVFSAPREITASDPEINDLIKRVIALPGETIEGRCPSSEQVCEVDIYIDNKLLTEPYLVEENKFYSPFEPTIIPANSLWVMGDNRDDSQDSASFGAISKDTIVGRAFFRLWPTNSFGFLS